MLRLSFLLAVLAAPVAAHEFWIAPQQYRVEPGETIEAHLRNGENFKGSALSFLPRNFRRFDMVRDGKAHPVPGRAGDMPALSMPADRPGLATVVHVTTDTVLTYRDWQKFENFVTHKDARWVLAAHADRGLPQVPLRERYSRYAKSLIAVGDGAGQDAAVGMTVEIVALANPYTDNMTDGLPVQVLYRGGPVTGAQIELFERAPDGQVSVSLHRADGRGQVVLPVLAGHEYLADHVVLRPIDPETGDGPVWESLWAALTFAIPD